MDTKYYAVTYNIDDVISDALEALERPFDTLKAAQNSCWRDKACIYATYNNELALACTGKYDPDDDIVKWDYRFPAGTRVQTVTGKATVLGWVDKHLKIEYDPYTLPDQATYIETTPPHMVDIIDDTEGTDDEPESTLSSEQS